MRRASLSLARGSRTVKVSYDASTRTLSSVFGSSTVYVLCAVYFVPCTVYFLHCVPYTLVGEKKVFYYVLLL